ncbi:hypothetical protein GGS24DRAFT_291901 [Hypoxylon argillaceum]|nr:hypothetical protein GGS24DRAFT_291901 [Hypoxylon argillaceum]
MASTDDPALYRIRELSMQQSLSPRLSLPMTPPEPDHGRAFSGATGDVAVELDRLVHRLNRKPIFQDSLRWHFLDQDGGHKDIGETGADMGFRYEGLNDISTHVPEQWQPLEPTPVLSPVLGPIPEASMQDDPYPRTTIPTPLPCEPCQPLQPLQSPGLSRPHGLVPDVAPEDKTLSKPSDIKRPRRSTDTRLHKSASNLRMLDLVTGMIENGVQCNVQNSSPPSPSKTPSTSSAFPASMNCIEPQDPVTPLALPGRMQLEIDMCHGELDEEALLNDNLALRHASAPAGIRKFGLLRYRSSSEAAQSCKNMKKSVPRMRRRRRTSPARISETSASASTSRPPSTMS